MGKWQAGEIGQYFDLEPGFAFKSSDFRDFGVPIIKIKNIKAGRFSDHEFGYVDQSFLSLRPRKVARFDDLLISMSGNRHDGSPETWVGKVAPFRRAEQCLINQRVGALRVKPNAEIDVRFMGFLLASEPYQRLFIAVATSSGGQANLSPNQILSATINIPPIRDQRAIGNLLGSVDDKIELNRRMNETLEGMAQAIFRDWFVDFGPVRRKLAGASVPTAILGGLIADPAQAANVAALFPDTLGDDGLPVGWEPNTLDSMLNLTYGKALPKTARTDGEIPVYGSGGIGGFHNEALVKGPGIIVGRKGTVGSLFWEPGDFFAIDTVFYVEPKDGYSLQFLWQLLQIMGLEGMNTDAAVPGLNRNNAHRLDVVCPPQPVLDAFDDLGGLLRQRLDACNAENHTLAETRGYLLPRLMSGKVRVADAERLTK